MPQLVSQPAVLDAAGTPPKKIEEFVGRVRTDDSSVSVARMKAPAGWIEPYQTPDFREITVVLSGVVRVEHEGGVMEVRAGQAVITAPGERVRYSTPEEAEYVAICLPAFSPDHVHREGDG